MTKNEIDQTDQIRDLTNLLAKNDFFVPAIEVETEDGSVWSIRSVAPGRGRRDDASWGPKAGAKGGFRLFAVDTDEMTFDEEQNPSGSDTWTAAELKQYLAAKNAN